MARWVITHRPPQNSTSLTLFGHPFRNIDLPLGAGPHIASTGQILYTAAVEYPFPPVGIVGAADGKNRRAFLCLLVVYPGEKRHQDSARLRRVKHGGHLFLNEFQTLAASVFQTVRVQDSHLAAAVGD